MLTKPSQSVLRVLCAFGTETTFRWNLKLGRIKMHSSTFVLAKILNNNLKRYWQSRPKLCFECSVPSVQKPLSQELEVWKHENGMVNTHCCQNVGEQLEESFEKMWSKRFHSDVPVLHTSRSEDRCWNKFDSRRKVCLCNKNQHLCLLEYTFNSKYPWDFNAKIQSFPHFGLMFSVTNDSEVRFI